jgi:hypothetical protein
MIQLQNYRFPFEIKHSGVNLKNLSFRKKSTTARFCGSPRAATQSFFAIRAPPTSQHWSAATLLEEVED